ncbi:MAG: hypothetical protein MRY21_01040 [Simkaniaceae bacterium]|nr:hypothetical protein [Simkaniaceae bacterium]
MLDQELNDLALEKLIDEVRPEGAVYIFGKNVSLGTDKYNVIIGSAVTRDPVSLSPAEMLHAQKVMMEGKQVLDKVDEVFPELKSYRYSDDDLDYLCAEVGAAKPKELEKFLSSLRDAEQISGQQFEKMVSKYQLRSDSNSLEDYLNSPELLAEMLDAHLASGGKFVCGIQEGKSYFESALFFEYIISNPKFEYQEYPTYIEIKKTS